MPKVYSVWYTYLNGGACLYVNNVATLEAAKLDLRDVLKKRGVSRAWIKLLEESVAEEAFPPVDPMLDIYNMDERTAKEALFQLQTLVKATLAKLPVLRDNTLNNIPEAVNHFVCKTEEQTNTIHQLEEEVARLRKVVSSVAESLGNGSAISDEASIEFIEQLPKEVQLYTKNLTERYNHTAKMRDNYRKQVDYLLEKLNERTEK
jgi:hypothetical protein